MFSGWFGLGSSIPNFPYTLGDEAGEFCSLGGVTWQMRDATATETNEPVTVFMLQIAGPDADAMKEAVGKNALKRAKTLRLPGVLRCFDAVDHKGTVYIATERCSPLRSALSVEGRTHYYDGNEDRFLEGVALGLHTVASALSSMHSNNIAHQNVSSDSVVVLPSGEWRLFGLEFAGGADEEHGVYRKYRSAQLEHRIPAGRGLDSVSSVDAWGLGCLIYESFAAPGSSMRAITHADLRAPTAVPRKLHPTLSGLLAADPKMRWTMDRFLRDCSLLKDSSYVADLQGLSELTLRDASERDTFLRKLAAHVDDYPLQACKLLVLPKLSNAVQYGACSATVLEPLLRIGARLNAEDFGTHVSPSVVTMFASPEPLVRQRLLTSAEEYAKLLPATLVRDKIWAHYATGFVHKSPEIRELSVRALVHFAPHLGEKIVTADVLRYITQLQQDREGPIRTNSTICLSMVASFIPEAERMKALMNGFGRMLKDPFVPSRLAAVRSFSSNLDAFSADNLAKQIVPNLSPMMLDAEPDVRKAAAKCVTTALKKIEAHAATLGAPEKPSSVPTTPVATEAPKSAAPTTPSAASEPGASRSWFGWGTSASPAPAASASTSPPPASAAPADPPAPITGANDTDVGSTGVPEAPTARRAAQSLHEDPAPKPATGDGWNDDFDEPEAPKPVPVVGPRVVRTAAVGAKPGGGMSLRKKGLGGAKKAE